VCQSDMEKILRSDGTVPDERLFGDSTRSTPHVQFGRVKKKFEREGNTVVRLQCYRLPPCELPTGLRGSPVLWRLAAELNGSTARSIEQLGDRVWGSSPNGWLDNNVENGIHQLRHDGGLNVVSTGYHQLMINTWR
jgi:hypothetical protein